MVQQLLLVGRLESQPLRPTVDVLAIAPRIRRAWDALAVVDRNLDSPTMRRAGLPWRMATSSTRSSGRFSTMPSSTASGPSRWGSAPTPAGGGAVDDDLGSWARVGRDRSGVALRAYSVTTFEPGARLVFTHGLRVRPCSTAFFATRPAPIITLGFDVFVQLVIAAMTTDPCSSCRRARPPRRRRPPRDASAPPPSSPPFSRSGSAAANDVFAFDQRHAILRPPRTGEARLDRGEIELQRVGVDRVRRRVGAEQPLRARIRFDQRDLRASRPVSRRYSSVMSSIGKIATVAPYSGHMLPSVTRSAIVRCFESGTEELDELADDALLAQRLGDREHEVGRGRAFGQPCRSAGSRRPAESASSSAGRASRPPLRCRRRPTPPRPGH